MEAIVIGLAIPVAIVGEHANRGLAGGIGGGLAVCAVLIGGVVGRPRMGWALGREPCCKSWSSPRVS